MIFTRRMYTSLRLKGLKIKSQTFPPSLVTAEKPDARWIVSSPSSLLSRNLFIAFRVFHPIPSSVIAGSIVRHGSSRVRWVPSKQTGPVFTHKIVFLWLPTTNSVSLVSIEQWSRSPCTTHALPPLVFSSFPSLSLSLSHTHTFTGLFVLSLSLSFSLRFCLRFDCCRWQCINQEDDCTHQRRCIEWKRGGEGARGMPGGRFQRRFQERD